MPADAPLSLLGLLGGAVAATGVCVLLGVGAAVSYLLRRRVGWFSALVCVGALLAGATAALTALRHAQSEILIDLGQIGTRGVLASFEGVRAVQDLAGRALDDGAMRLPPLDETRDALLAIESAIWAYHRAGAWNETRLRDALQSNLPALAQLRTRLEDALEKVSCRTFETAADTDWTYLVRDAWYTHRERLNTLGEGFAGDDYIKEDPAYVSRPYRELAELAQPIAATGAVLVIACAFIAYRRRAFVRSDAVVLFCGAGVLTAAFAMFAYGHGDGRALSEHSFVLTKQAFEAVRTVEVDLFNRDDTVPAGRVTVAWPDLAATHRAHVDALDQLHTSIDAWNQTDEGDDTAGRIRAELVSAYRTDIFLRLQFAHLHCADAPAQDPEPLRRYRNALERASGAAKPLQAMLDAR